MVLVYKILSFLFNLLLQSLDFPSLWFVSGLLIQSQTLNECGEVGGYWLLGRGERERVAGCRS